MKATRAVEIKGSALPVLRVVVREGDPQSLGQEIERAVAKARPLLAEAVAVLDLRERAADELGPSEILQAVRNAGVNPAAVLTADAGMRNLLAGSELPIIESPVILSERPPRESNEEPPSAEPEQTVSMHETPPDPSPELIRAACLARPLRSGQRFYAQGRDVVVLSPTSRGSELIADGSIYAFSTLRGRTLAGASGDTSAVIIATHFDPELIAIAGVYRTLDAADVAGFSGEAVSVGLAFDDEGVERLVVAPLSQAVPIGGLPA
jgi:septum site-determining protein MinC